MKTLTNEKLADIVKAVGGDVPASSVTLPPTGAKLKVKDIKVMDGVPQRDEKGALTGEVSNPWVRVDFEPSGMLSLNGILRSPDITWEGLDTNTERIKALCACADLQFTHQESLTSRAGQPYKRNHFVPITLKATVAAK